MNSPLLRTVLAFSLAALLAACGAGTTDQPDAQGTSLMTGVSTTSAAISAAGTGVTSAGTTTTTANTSTSPGTGSTGAAPAIPVASAAGPQPDCAAEGCSSPRIIDGNAEAWRYAAMQRTAAESAQS